MTKGIAMLHSRPLWRLVVFTIIGLATEGRMDAHQVIGKAGASAANLPITVVARTDRDKYSQADTISLDVSLHNISGATVYVDSRMFWGGLAGGLKVVLSDHNGKPLPLHGLPDLMMPPPPQDDLQILVRLDSGFFFGTRLTLPVNRFFPRAGRFSIRVIYNSMIRQDLVAPQLRELPAVWAGTPAIPSQLVWIEVE